MCNIKAVSFTYPLEILHLTEYFYTTSGCDGCDKYEVCLPSVSAGVDFNILLLTVRSLWGRSSSGWGLMSFAACSNYRAGHFCLGRFIYGGHRSQISKFNCAFSISAHLSNVLFSEIYHFAADILGLSG